MAPGYIFQIVTVMLYSGEKTKAMPTVSPRQIIAVTTHTFLQKKIINNSDEWAENTFSGEK